MLVLALGAASPASASSVDEPVNWFFDFGYSGVSGDADTILNGGYSLGFGAILHPDMDMPLGIRLDINYDWRDVDTGTIPDLGIKVNDGDASQRSIRAGLHYASDGDRARFTAGAGVGGYHLYARLTETVIVPGWVCDPFWPYYCYPGWVQGQVVKADDSLTKFGYYATLGVASRSRTPSSSSKGSTSE